MPPQSPITREARVPPPRPALSRVAAELTEHEVEVARRFLNAPPTQFPVNSMQRRMQNLRG